MFKKLFKWRSPENTSEPSNRDGADNWPPTIDPSEVEVRTADVLYRRLIALWAVTAKAKFPDNDFFLEYVIENNILEWLSPLERKFLTDEHPSERDQIAFSWRAEAIAFLCWCGGIVSQIKLEGDTSNPEEFIDLFPFEFDDRERLRAAIKIRDKSELVLWSDRLYHAHGKIRSAEESQCPHYGAWTKLWNGIQQSTGCCTSSKNLKTGMKSRPILRDSSGK